MSGRLLGVVGILGLAAAAAFAVHESLGLDARSAGGESPPAPAPVERSPASTGTVPVAPRAVAGDPAAAPRVVADASGFTPGVLTLPRGGPGDIVFRRTTDDTCATAVVFPELGIERELPLGQDVTVTVPTAAARTWAFQCGMGMYRSRVVVR